MPSDYITPGTYNAKPMRWAVGPCGKSNLPAVSIEFRLTATVKASGDDPLGDDGPVIRNDFYLQGKDGGLLAFNLDALRDALGWPGQLGWFATVNDLPEVQIVIADDEYNGNVRSKVAFLNKLGSVGRRSVRESDPAVVQSLEAQIGARIRAHFGGVSQPAQKPAAPAAKPPAPPAPPAPPKPPAPPAKPVATATEAEAWAAFSAQAAALEFDEAKTTQLWFDVIGHYAKGADVTPQEWAKIREHKLDGMPF